MEMLDLRSPYVKLLLRHPRFSIQSICYKKERRHHERLAESNDSSEVSDICRAVLIQQPTSSHRSFRGHMPQEHSLPRRTRSKSMKQAKTGRAYSQDAARITFRVKSWSSMLCGKKFNSPQVVSALFHKCYRQAVLWYLTKAIVFRWK